MAAMLQTYRTDYPNQVHQLSVSVSKHLYITKSGCLKFQSKPMDTSLGKPSKLDKTHVIHYLLRDHFSGVFYGEICSSSSLFPLEDYLLRAWSKKNEYIFCGIPEYLTVPKTVATIFPNIYQFLQSLEIQTIKVTSGFQGGVRDVKTWEEHIRWNAFAEDEWKIFNQVQSKTTELSAELNNHISRFDSKIRKWVNNIKLIKLPTGELCEIAF